MNELVEIMIMIRKKQVLENIPDVGMSHKPRRDIDAPARPRRLVAAEEYKTCREPCFANQIVRIQTMVPR